MRATALLVATRLGETQDLWRAHAMLAELFLKAGDLAAAGLHLDEAIKRAPDEATLNLQQLKARFSGEHWVANGMDRGDGNVPAPY